MKFRAFQVLAAITMALLAVQVVAPGSALAHERRTVGKYTFVVGFIVEPAIAGQPNGIDLRISDADTNEPVEGAEKTLKASIAFGGLDPKEFSLRARFGQKGAYTADLIPTRAGTYVFTFTGTVGSQQISEKFESGPGRFNDVAPASDFHFPEVLPPPGELQKLATEAERRATVAEAAAAQSQKMGVGGIAVGALGLLVGGAAFISGRRREGTTIRQSASVK